ncbi:ATP synthase delta chain [hydrothermal vent metagenome]|uniref:ATP synthase delta chain n=1 Tax=hydrothermal vent metagenome TaxID=652676 RepID=A0A3B0WEK2_9ZZZZ
MGGVIIKAGDTIIDASMKSQLDSLALSLAR